LVLSWDSSEFNKCAKEIEKAKGGPSKAHLDAIKNHIQSDRSEHLAVRQASINNSTSIIIEILKFQQTKESGDLAATLREEQHEQCLEYYSALLSIRDRSKITDVLCRSVPDHATQAIRDFIAAFEPLIRGIHDNVDLSEHMDANQALLDDFIRTSQVKKTASPGCSGKKQTYRLPSVEDYVNLVHRNRGVLYKFLHHLVSKCPEVAESFRTTIKAHMLEFRVRTEPSSLDMKSSLDSLVAALPESDREKVLAALDSHVGYLTSIQIISSIRMQQILDRSGLDNLCGPGIYLARWQSLLDETVITPATAEGQIRHGKDVKHISAQGKSGSTEKIICKDDETARKQAIEDVPDAPDVKIVVDCLGNQFRNLIRQRARER
jgi:hypothetical protein